MTFGRHLVVRLAYMNSSNGSSGFRARVQRWREDMLARFVPRHCVGDRRRARPHNRLSVQIYTTQDELDALVELLTTHIV